MDNHFLLPSINYQWHIIQQSMAIAHYMNLQLETVSQALFRGLLQNSFSVADPVAEATPMQQASESTCQWELNCIYHTNPASTKQASRPIWPKLTSTAIASHYVQKPHYLNTLVSQWKAILPTHRAHQWLTDCSSSNYYSSHLPYAVASNTILPFYSSSNLSP